jgi:DUF1009 family protein
VAGSGEPIGLIAGNGVLPLLFAREARAQGLRVVALAHRGETDPALEREVEALHWVRVGQVARMERLLQQAGVGRAVMAGGIGKLRAFAEARPDLGALRILSRLPGFLDDGLLRAVAQEFESRGIAIVSVTELLPRLLAPQGRIAGRPLTRVQTEDVALGMKVAAQLGEADVGQTVVVRQGIVLAVEAVEGTDAAIRRAGLLGGPGQVVVKRAKPRQDTRFDLPAVGPATLAVMKEAAASVLAVEAHRTLLLQADLLARDAERAGIAVVGVSPVP